MQKRDSLTDRSLRAGEVFFGIDTEYLRGATPDIEVRAIEFSSRDVSDGSLFFCVPGTVCDGHDFAEDALHRGVAGLVVERELDLDIAQFKVASARDALALCSANFYGYPSEKVQVVGITGTNGKTTTAFLVEHLARCAGKVTGLMGTVECHIADTVVPSLHTTLESRDFQRMLFEMENAHVDVCACEISSHALDLGRTLGTKFAVAAFTNLTQDHLDYHKTMDSYFEAKARLFTEYEVGACVICTDSNHGKQLSDLSEQCSRRVIRVGSDMNCDVRVEKARFAPHSTAVELSVQGENVSFEFPLVGRFNVENMLVCFGIGCALGIETQTIVSALKSAPQVPGRLERVVGSAGTLPEYGVLVDYAHTPDSVAKAIQAVKAVTQGKVICVFGCGGDRDHDKRPKMGKAALSADYAIVTSDNPRTEDPDAIIGMIVPGMEGHEDRFSVVPDRKEAIRAALERAMPGDCVLIAGKGHEDYQIIGTVKHPFDDRRIAADTIEELS